LDIRLRSLAAPTANENGLPEGKPLQCWVAVVRNLTRKRVRIR
jgi:hypothetical protein